MSALASRDVAAAAVAESARKGYLDGQALQGVFTWLRPNDFLSPLTAIFGGAALVIPRPPLSPEKGRGDHIIEDEDHHRGRNDSVGRRLADALRPATRIIAVVTAHQRHDEAEYGGLDQT